MDKTVYQTVSGEYVMTVANILTAELNLIINDATAKALRILSSASDSLVPETRHFLIKKPSTRRKHFNLYGEGAN